MTSVKDIRSIFINKLKREQFVLNKDKSKMLEIISANFIADEEVIFGKLNIKYAKKELDWYLSQSLNIGDMGELIPEIWQKIANKFGNIHSNYGTLIFSQRFYSQYATCLSELIKDPNTRRAIMVYLRPSIMNDCEMSLIDDVICTWGVSVFIRDNLLIYSVNMRSNDVIFGYKNDLYWHKFVHNKLLNDLSPIYSNLSLGPIYWHSDSLHIYERHFNLIESYIGDNFEV